MVDLEGFEAPENFNLHQIPHGKMFVPGGRIDSYRNYSAPEKMPGKIEQAIAEVERRTETGTEIKGLPFKTDDATIIRLHNLLDAFDMGIVSAEGVNCTNSAGNKINLANTETFQATYNAASEYRMRVLEASSVLQAKAAIPADYADDMYWPKFYLASVADHHLIIPIKDFITFVLSNPVNDQSSLSRH